VSIVDKADISLAEYILCLVSDQTVHSALILLLLASHNLLLLMVLIYI